MVNLPKPSAMPYLFLATIVCGLLFSLAMRLTLDFNGGHIDEYDYLFVGKQLLAGKHWNTYSYIFGSNLDWYLLGIGEAWNGLTGARFIALILGIISLFGIYSFAHALWQSKAIAYLSAALLAMQAAHIFISKFATYDIIALAFFSLSLPVLIHACKQPHKTRYLLITLAIALCALAVTSKYIVVAYVPLLIGVAWWLSPQMGLLFASGIVLVLGMYAGWHWQDLQMLYAVQIKGTHGVNSNYAYIFRVETLYLALPLFLWLIAVIWQLRQNSNLFHNRTALILGLLLLFALPLVFYHLHGRNMISLYKHLVYALFFLTPAMAWLLWNGLQRWQNHLGAQAIAGAVIITMVGANYAFLRAMENGYPDVRPIIAAINAQPLDENTTIASEDPYLMRYALFGKLTQNRIKELGYMDNNMDGKFEPKDAIEAVWDRKFTYVFLDNLLQPHANNDLRGVLQTRGYQKIVEIPWQTSEVMSRQKQGVLELYKSTQPPRIPTAEDAMFK